MLKRSIAKFHLLVEPHDSQLGACKSIGADFFKGGRKIIQLHIRAIIERQITHRGKPFREFNSFQFTTLLKHSLAERCHEIRQFYILERRVFGKSRCEIVAITAVSRRGRGATSPLVTVLFAQVVMVDIGCSHTALRGVDNGAIFCAVVRESKFRDVEVGQVSGTTLAGGQIFKVGAVDFAFKR